MKQIDVYRLNAMLSQTSFNDIRDGKFQYAISKNRSLLESESKVQQSAIDALKTEELKAMQDELKELISPKIKPGMSENQVAVIEAEVIESYEKRDQYRAAHAEFSKQLTDFYDTDSDFKPHRIKLELIEKLPLNDQQMQAVFGLVDDGEEAPAI